MLLTGELGVNVIAIKASVHLPYDHRMLVQNLTAQVIIWLWTFSAWFLQA